MCIFYNFKLFFGNWEYFDFLKTKDFLYSQIRKINEKHMGAHEDLPFSRFLPPFSASA